MMRRSISGWSRSALRTASELGDVVGAMRLPRGVIVAVLVDPCPPCWTGVSNACPVGSDGQRFNGHARLLLAAMLHESLHRLSRLTSVGATKDTPCPPGFSGDPGFPEPLGSPHFAEGAPDTTMAAVDQRHPPEDVPSYPRFVEGASARVRGAGQPEHAQRFAPVRLQRRRTRCWPRRAWFEPDLGLEQRAPLL